MIEAIGCVYKGTCAMVCEEERTSIAIPVKTDQHCVEKSHSVS